MQIRPPARSGATILTAPSGLTATVLSGTSIKLDWTDNESGTAEYEVVKDTTLVTTTAAGATTYTVTGLTAGTNYAFAVRAKKGGPAYSAYAVIAKTPAYQYGYPTFTANGTEPNVVAQWLFDETSGNPTDEVGSIALTPTQYGSACYITYNSTDGGSAAWAGVQPGIITQGTNNNMYFYINGSATSLNIGTGNCTLEWISRYNKKNNGGTGTSTIYYTCDNSVAHGIYIYYDSISTTPTINYWIKASDGTLLSASVSLSTNPFDEQIHKHRVVLNRSGNATYYIDGVSQGTVSLASLSGKTIECSQVELLAATNSGVNTLNATMYEFRQSNNATNNSGGPGGG